MTYLTLMNIGDLKLPAAHTAYLVIKYMENMKQLLKIQPIF